MGVPSLVPSPRASRISRVDPVVAMRIAGAFNALLGAAFLLAGWALILVADRRGLLQDLNGMLRDLGGGPSLSTPRLLLLWALVVLLWVAALTALAGLATVVLNEVLRRVGGLDLDAPVSRPPVREQVVAVARRWARAVESAARQPWWQPEGLVPPAGAADDDDRLVG